MSPPSSNHNTAFSFWVNRSRDPVCHVHRRVSAKKVFQWLVRDTHLKRYTLIRFWRSWEPYSKLVFPCFFPVMLRFYTILRVMETQREHDERIIQNFTDLWVIHSSSLLIFIHWLLHVTHISMTAMERSNSNDVTTEQVGFFFFF